MLSCCYIRRRIGIYC